MSTKYRAMRHMLLCIMAILPRSLAADAAVSLSSFNDTRIVNLPAPCQEIYVMPIEACTRKDFPSVRDPNADVACSSACASGIRLIEQFVCERCSDVQVPADTTIAIALSHRLVAALCPLIAVHRPSSTSSPSESTTQATETSTTQAAQTSSTRQAESSSSSEAVDSASRGPEVTIVPGPSSTPAATSTTDSPEQSAPLVPSSTSQGLAIDTDSPPSTPTDASLGQKSNPDSGGGSPFDVQLGSASHIRNGHFILTAILGVSAGLVCFL